MVEKLDVHMQDDEIVHLQKTTKINEDIGLQTLIVQQLSRK